MSSNPFRRPKPSTTQTAPELQVHTGGEFEDIFGTAPAERPREAARSKTEKIVKHVRVQSPPPLSPDSPGDERRRSIGGRLPQGDEGRALDRGDPFGAEVIEDEKYVDEEEDTTTDEDTVVITRNSSSGVPANPFSKTLATLERTDEEEEEDGKTKDKAKRATMDVDAFHKMLMAGVSSSSSSATATPSAIPEPTANHFPTLSSFEESITSPKPAPAVPTQNIAQAAGISPQAVFEADPERNPLLRQDSKSERKKPPPPSSRHGRAISSDSHTSKPTLQTVTSPPQPPSQPVRPPSHALQSPPTSSISIPSTISIPKTTATSPTPITPSNRSFSDLNKPLPHPPPRNSHDSDRESIFDREAAGKVPEPPSPVGSFKSRNAPPVPTARRSERDNKRVSSFGEEGKKPIGEGFFANPHIATVAGQPMVQQQASGNGSGGGSAGAKHHPAPPPPPHGARRPGSVRRSSNSSASQVNLHSNPSVASLPIHMHPAPSIGSTASLSSLGSSYVNLAPSQSFEPDEISPLPQQSTAPPSAPSRITPPAPPPARTPSVRLSRSGRPSSVYGLDISSKRGAPPPPPPPHRSKTTSTRTSMDDPSPAHYVPEGKVSDAYFAKHLAEKGVAVGTGIGEEEEKLRKRERSALEGQEGSGLGGLSGKDRHDILADISKLQREIDELRERGGG